jgi:hypothetical protein
MNKKSHKHSNPELAAAMRDLRKSNAAQPHEDRRTKRARSRQAQKQKAIKEQENG